MYLCFSLCVGVLGMALEWQELPCAVVQRCLGTPRGGFLMLLRGTDEQELGSV